MAALRIESNHLLLYDPDKSRTTVHCFIAAPTPLEERMLGRLFFVIELNSNEAPDHQLIHAMQRELHTYYYQSEDFHIESAFEKALQRLNDRLHSIMGQQTADWIKKANMLVGVVKETSLHFSVIGRMHAFLIHRQRILDILESSTGAPETPSAVKIFSNIISGHLSLNDALLFCTTSLLDYLSQEKLKRVISEHGPDASVQTLEQLLNEAEGSTSFAAVVIRLSAIAGQEEEFAAVSPVREPSAISQPQISMEQLMRREQKTNELLTHPLWPNISRIVKNGVQQLGSAMGSVIQKQAPPKPAALTRDEQPEASSNVTERETLDEASRPESAGVQRKITTGGRYFVVVISSIATFVARLWKVLRPSKAPGTLRDMPRGVNRRIAHGARWMQTMTPGRRRLFLVALIFILLFAQNVVNVGKNRQKKQTLASYQQFINEAKDQVNAADAALLINNESGARAALQKARDDLKKIPANQKRFQQQTEPVKADIETRLQQIRHSIAVQPETLTDLAALDVGFQPVSFALAENAVYTFNGRTSSLYRIAIASKTAETVVDSPTLENALQYFVIGAATPTMMQAGGSLQQYSGTGKKLAALTVQYPTPVSSIQDAAFYNKRLYTLDAANNRIYRHELSGTTYSTGKSWLTADIDVRNARSFAIDGSVYLVDATGKILRLTNGKPDGTNFDAADPALTDPKSVFTSAELSTLFVLDPANRRVLEYDKKGGFLRQYVADSLTEAKDFLVNNGTVYVLSGTRVLTFPLTK